MHGSVLNDLIDGHQLLQLAPLERGKRQRALPVVQGHLRRNLVLIERLRNLGGIQALFAVVSNLLVIDLFREVHRSRKNFGPLRLEAELYRETGDPHDLMNARLKQIEYGAFRVCSYDHFLRPAFPKR